MSVQAIPKGYHTLTPHLVVRACAEAIDFWKRAFGAEELVRVPSPGGGLMHAEIKIGDSILMLTDENPQWGCLSPLSLNGAPMTLTLYSESADAVFDRAVEAGCTVKMPMDNMFWGDRYGQVVDPYGFVWAVAQHVEDPTPEQIQERMAAMFAAKG